MDINNLITRDLKTIWHPCSQMKDHENFPLLPIKCGDGVWLEDFQGQRYIDAISSWWVNLFGHSNKYINQKIMEQLSKLEQVILAGFTHQPIVELSEKLLDLAPIGLSKCFYADSGSAAIEVALKMSYHYWQNVGQTKKTKFVVLKNAYHGETVGAMSLSQIDLYTKTYQDLLFEKFVVDSPDCFYREAGETWEAYSLRKFVEMENLLSEKNAEIAAVIIEPLVQCAAGMRMYHPIYLKKLRSACDKYQVHLIADEIAVGFGRTGSLFACEKADITPDFLCLAKGLTGGYLPLSVVLTKEIIYQAFYADYTAHKAFLHSHSYTGNPLACSAALATLELFKINNTLENNLKLINYMEKAGKILEDDPNIAELRQTGMIFAIELKENNISIARIDKKIAQFALSQGVLLRPLGKVIYFMPPYVINFAELDQLFKTARDGINYAYS